MRTSRRTRIAIAQVVSAVVGTWAVAAATDRIVPGTSKLVIGLVLSAFTIGLAAMTAAAVARERRSSSLVLRMKENIQDAYSRALWESPINPERG